MPHVHAARYVLVANRVAATKAPDSYRYLHFIKTVADDTMQPLIEKYLESAQQNMRPERMEEWRASFSDDTAHVRIYHAVQYEQAVSHFLMYCNGMKDYAAYQNAIHELSSSLLSEHPEM